MLAYAELLWGDRRGATAIEYGLIIALIGIAVMGAMSTFAGETVEMWNGVSSTISSTLANN